VKNQSEEKQKQGNFGAYSEQAVYIPCLWEPGRMAVRAILTETEEQPAAKTCLLWFHRFHCDANHWNSRRISSVSKVLGGHFRLF